jgi:hypothetical protein
MSDRTGAAIALILYAFGGTVGIVWRSWRQWRRTGSTGFRGVGGRPGSPEWLGGLGLVTAVCVTVAAPALQLAGLFAPLRLLNAAWIQALGIARFLARNHTGCTEHACTTWIFVARRCDRATGAIR